MRDHYRLPVKFDKTEGYWFYDGPAAELPAILISAGDRLAMLLSLQAAEQFRGIPVHDNLKALHVRLLETLSPESRTNYAALAARIRSEGPPVPLMPRGVWDTVLNALDAQTTLSFEYRTGHNGQIHRREVDPYGLIIRHRDWFLVGHDHCRDSIRTFFLPRMREVEDTDRTFFVRGGFTMDAYLATAVDGQQSTGPVARVVLRFEAEAAHLGEEYVWNQTQQISQDEAGRVVVSFETGALYEVERQVLAWGGRVKVLEPDVLREAVIRAARSILSW